MRKVASLVDSNFRDIFEIHWSNRHWVVDMREVSAAPFCKPMQRTVTTGYGMLYGPAGN